MWFELRGSWRLECVKPIHHNVNNSWKKNLTASSAVYLLRDNFLQNWDGVGVSRDLSRIHVVPPLHLPTVAERRMVLPCGYSMGRKCSVSLDLLLRLGMTRPKLGLMVFEGQLEQLSHRHIYLQS